MVFILIHNIMQAYLLDLNVNFVEQKTVLLFFSVGLNQLVNPGSGSDWMLNSLPKFIYKNEHAF